MKELYGAMLQEICEDSLARAVLCAMLKLCLWIFVGAVSMSLIYTTDFIAVSTMRQVIFGGLITLGVGVVILADTVNVYLPRINAELAKSNKKWKNR